MIDYGPLWNTLKRKEVTQYELVKYARVSAATIESMKKNRSVSLKTIERFCKLLRCTIGDIVEVDYND